VYDGEIMNQKTTSNINTALQAAAFNLNTALTRLFYVYLFPAYNNK
jgi:hypothetical protein